MIKVKADKSDITSEGSFMQRVIHGDRSDNLSMFKSDDSCIERLESNDTGSIGQIE